MYGVAFHEVTPGAVRRAMAESCAIDMDLTRAWRAHRTLDYLVGYGPLPLLWGKLPGFGSPGRVQSVAGRLACGREAEIEGFRAARVLGRRGGGGRGRARFRASLAVLDGAEIGERGSTRKPSRARPGSARPGVVPRRLGGARHAEVLFGVQFRRAVMAWTGGDGERPQRVEIRCPGAPKSAAGRTITRIDGTDTPCPSPRRTEHARYVVTGAIVEADRSRVREMDRVPSNRGTIASGG